MIVVFFPFVGFYLGYARVEFVREATFHDRYWVTDLVGVDYSVTSRRAPLSSGLIYLSTTVASRVVCDLITGTRGVDDFLRVRGVGVDIFCTAFWYIRRELGGLNLFSAVGGLFTFLAFVPHRVFWFSFFSFMIGYS